MPWERDYLIKNGEMNIRFTDQTSVRHVEILCLVVTLWTSLYYSIRLTDSNDIFEILIFGHFDHFWPLGRSKVVIFTNFIKN